MTMKNKHWFRIHSFTGVITGLLLFFIFWTGSFAVISHELDWLVNPATHLEPQTQKASWGSMVQLVKEKYPESKINSIHKQEYRNSPYVAYASFPDKSYRDIHINPYIPEIVYTGYGFDLARFFRNLHYNLFGVGTADIGSYLVMLFGLVMFTSLISAMFLYKRWWVKFFQFRRDRKGYAFWTQLHKLAGLWSLWFLFIIALTGSYYLYEKFQWDTGLLGPQKLNYVGAKGGNFGAVEIPDPDTDTTKALLPIDSMVQVAHERWPGLEIQSINFYWPQDDSGSVSIQGHAGTMLSRSLIRERGNQINLDRRTGETLLKSTTADLPVFWIINNAADPLHFGYFGGLTTKIIWFVFGLILCGLVLTGTYLHIKKLGKKNGIKKHGWTGIRAAVIVSLLILIATIPYGFLQAREWYGPMVDGEKQLPELIVGVKIFIIVWIMLTIGIIGLWVEKLWKNTQ